MKWSGNIDAQRQADVAYAKLRPKKKAKKKNRRQLARQRRKLPRKERVVYSQYIRSEKWKRIRERALTTHGRECRICYSTENLQVHHLTYKHLGREQMEDLVVLCGICHKNVHEAVAGAEGDLRRGVFSA